MGGDAGLHHQRGRLRIDAAGDEQSGDFADFGPQFGRLLIDGDGMQIDHAKDAFEVVLQPDKVLDCPEIIADVEVAGRLHPRKYACLGHESGRILS